MNVVIGLKDADFVFREFDPENQSAMAEMKGARCDTHVKPFIKVNSCFISPPDDLAFSLALVSSSSLAFSFKVTYNLGQHDCLENDLWAVKFAYIVERHLG